MDVITIDFETYYDKDFSLSKMTTEEYIRDPLFEVIGVAVKVNDGEAEWASGTHSELKVWLRQFDWENAMAVAHNAMFDGAILNWRFDIKPKVWVDTLCMGRALHGVEVSGSLAALAVRENVGEKGTEVLNALGKHRADFSPEQLARYGDYCINDVELTYKLFNKMVGRFPKKELRLVDVTIRMFTEPVLELNIPMLHEHLQEVQNKKAALLSESGVTSEELMSNPKFAEALMNLGVNPPMKKSPLTGKEAFAFAKSDEEFLNLLEHPDWRVQGLVAARLGLKSTLEETRTERFISIAERGPLPVPIKYYAAHTGRFGGSDKINLQNLPSRGVNGGKLKRAICAPEGYSFIDADSAQIEARVLVWLAGQEDVVNAFANKEDVYKKMAMSIYGKPEDQITKAERFVGKTTILGCFGADTQVLTSLGWKRIVEVQATDMLWDGESWVKHQGVISKGVRQTIRAWGVDATPEHEILTEHGWREWCEVVTNRSLSQSAFAKAHSLSLTGNNTLSPRVDRLDGTQLFDVTVGGKAELIGTTSRRSGLRGVISALKIPPTQPAKSTGVMKKLFQTLNIGRGYLIELQASFLDATQKLARHIHTTAGGASPYTHLGLMVEQSSYATSLAYPIGRTQAETLTVSTTPRAMNPVTYGLPPKAKTPETNERLGVCNRNLMTYDIAYAGPNNRFMIATDAGALIVHNCGYGMGAAKFQLALKASTPSVDISMDEARRIIDVYRKTNYAVTALWRQAQNALVALHQREEAQIGRFGIVKVLHEEHGIQFPSGLVMHYDDLQMVEGEKGLEFSYRVRKGRTRIYGGKVVENVCQAVARCLIGEQMLRIAKRYKVVLTVHDAIACVVPDAEVDEAQRYVEESMRWVPEWATGLPLNCESGIGKNYGDC